MRTGDRTPENKTRVDLAQLFEALDERSRAILWHLWWHRHAQLSELGSLIDVASDWEVLSRLKEVINERAQELCGRPVVSFEESKNDPLTGEKVLFSWWLLDGEDAPLTGRDKLLVDVFNEKESVTIVAQLPAWDSHAHTRMDSKNSTPEVKIKDVKCKNGVLQISLEKVRR
jgi:hypothetical protein